MAVNTERESYNNNIDKTIEIMMSFRFDSPMTSKITIESDDEADTYNQIDKDSKSNNNVIILGTKASTAKKHDTNIILENKTLGADEIRVIISDDEEIGNKTEFNSGLSLERTKVISKVHKSSEKSVSEPKPKRRKSNYMRGTKNNRVYEMKTLSDNNDIPNNTHLTHSKQKVESKKAEKKDMNKKADTRFPRTQITPRRKISKLSSKKDSKKKKTEVIADTGFLRTKITTQRKVKKLSGKKDSMRKQTEEICVKGKNILEANMYNHISLSNETTVNKNAEEQLPHTKLASPEEVKRNSEDMVIVEAPLQDSNINDNNILRNTVSLSETPCVVRTKITSRREGKKFCGKIDSMRKQTEEICVKDKNTLETNMNNHISLSNETIVNKNAEEQLPHTKLASPEEVKRNSEDMVIVEAQLQDSNYNYNNILRNTVSLSETPCVARTKITLPKEVNKFCGKVDSMRKQTKEICVKDKNTLETNMNNHISLSNETTVNKNAEEQLPHTKLASPEEVKRNSEDMVIVEAPLQDLNINDNSILRNTVSLSETPCVVRTKITSRREGKKFCGKIDSMRKQTEEICVKDKNTLETYMNNHISLSNETIVNKNAEEQLPHTKLASPEEVKRNSEDMVIVEAQLQDSNYNDNNILRNTVSLSETPCVARTKITLRKEVNKFCGKVDSMRKQTKEICVKDKNTLETDMNNHISLSNETTVNKNAEEQLPHTKLASPEEVKRNSEDMVIVEAPLQDSNINDNNILRNTVSLSETPCVVRTKITSRREGNKFCGKIDSMRKQTEEICVKDKNTLETNMNNNISLSNETIVNKNAEEQLPHTKLASPEGVKRNSEDMVIVEAQLQDSNINDNNILRNTVSLSETPCVARTSRREVKTFCGKVDYMRKQTEEICVKNKNTLEANINNHISLSNETIVNKNAEEQLPHTKFASPEEVKRNLEDVIKEQIQDSNINENNILRNTVSLSEMTCVSKVTDKNIEQNNVLEKTFGPHLYKMLEKIADNLLMLFPLIKEFTMINNKHLPKTYLKSFNDYCNKMKNKCFSTVHSSVTTLILPFKEDVQYMESFYELTSRMAIQKSTENFSMINLKNMCAQMIQWSEHNMRTEQVQEWKSFHQHLTNQHCKANQSPRHTKNPTLTNILSKSPAPLNPANAYHLQVQKGNSQYQLNFNKESSVHKTAHRANKCYNTSSSRYEENVNNPVPNAQNFQTFKAYTNEIKRLEFLEKNRTNYHGITSNNTKSPCATSAQTGVNSAPVVNITLLPKPASAQKQNLPWRNVNTASVASIPNQQLAPAYPPPPYTTNIPEKNPNNPLRQYRRPSMHQESSEVKIQQQEHVQAYEANSARRAFTPVQQRTLSIDSGVVTPPYGGYEQMDRPNAETYDPTSNNEVNLSFNPMNTSVSSLNPQVTETELSLWYNHQRQVYPLRQDLLLHY